MAPDPRSSIDKAFSILRSFGDNDPAGVGVSEVARRTNLSKSTAHRLLGALVENGAIERSGDVYRLGPLPFELTASRPNYNTALVSEVLTPFLAALFEQTRQTVHLAHLQGTEVAYVNKLFSAHRLSIPSRIGGRAPSYCTGVGKAMLAWDDAATEKVIEAGLTPWTKHTITDGNVLRHELAEIRISGIAFDREEISEGLYCIASPVFGLNNAPVAALSISSFASQLEAEQFIAPLKRVSLAATKAMTRFQRQHRPQE